MLHRSAQCAHPGSKDGWLSAKDIPQSEKLSLLSPDGDAHHWLLSVMCSAPDNNIWYRSVRAECFAGRIWVTAALVSRWHWTVSAKQTEFNAAYVYLADIDGSGTADILYARSDYIEIYRNRSGNGFDKPVTVKLPAGVRYNKTCRLQIADVQGLGSPACC